MHVNHNDNDDSDKGNQNKRHLRRNNKLVKHRYILFLTQSRFLRRLIHFRFCRRVTSTQFKWTSIKNIDCFLFNALDWHFHFSHHCWCFPIFDFFQIFEPSKEIVLYLLLTFTYTEKQERKNASMPTLEKVKIWMIWPQIFLAWCETYDKKLINSTHHNTHTKNDTRNG